MRHLPVTLTRLLLSKLTTSLFGTVGILLMLAAATSPVLATAKADDCVVMAGGVRFCPPARTPELTQCVRNMTRFPNRAVPQACRQSLVDSCRTVSDEQFEDRYKVQRPRLIDARATERTSGWNAFCPISLGYRYTPIARRTSDEPVASAAPAFDPLRMQAITKAGGDRYLVEPFDASQIVSLPDAGPCRCNDNTEPVFGFCTGPRGTYKPACAQ